MTLTDAPADYHEITDPDTGIGFCDQCPADTVQDEPCPAHGPATASPEEGMLPVYAELDDLVGLAGRVMADRSTHAVIEGEAAFNDLVRWGVIGYTPTRRLPVPIIHETHAQLVRTRIIARRGVLTGASPLTHLAMPALTARQRQIIELVAEGTTNRLIGRRLELSEDTIKTHVRRILHRMHAVDRTHLVHRAHQAGLFGGIPKPQAMHRA